MGHEYQDQVSLEMARRVAAGLPDHPEWLELARSNLRRWRTRNRDSPGLMRVYTEWAQWLDLPVNEICAMLTAETDEGQRIRQNSPFVGVLSPSEVWEIKRYFREEFQKNARHG